MLRLACRASPRLLSLDATRVIPSHSFLLTYCVKAPTNLFPSIQAIGRQHLRLHDIERISSLTCRDLGAKIALDKEIQALE